MNKKDAVETALHRGGVTGGTVHQRRSTEDSVVDSLLATKAEREAQILSFRIEQGQDGLVSLDAALEWLQECNRDLLTERIRKLWAALSDEASIFVIGGNLLPLVTIVQEDYSPPISEFTTIDSSEFASDLNAARKTKMYQDPLLLRELLKRFWLPRSPLHKLFQHYNWPTPPWLAADNQRENRNTGIGLSQANDVRQVRGKVPLVHDYFRKNFAAGVPGPAREPRKELLHKVQTSSKLLKNISDDTLNRAIKSFNLATNSKSN